MKRTKSKRNRFSGPELAGVLTQVQAEHGDAAPIRAVNKVRSGGIGGFFAREEFEIIVSSPGSEGSSEADDGYLSADARFRSMIEQRLAERDEALLDVARADAPQAELPPVVEQAEPEVVVEPELAAAVVEPDPEPEVVVEPEPAAPASPPGPVSIPSVGFWGRLEATRAELQRRPTSSAEVTCVVGPLRDTMGVARQLQHRRRSSPSPVYVLTTRAEIVSEPGWELVRDGGRLVRLVGACDGEPAVVVVDVAADHPIWLAPLIERLRAAGVGLVRHTVVGSVTPERIDGCRRVAGGSWELDLPMDIDPGQLMDLLDDGVAVSTVGGADLGPELLVALRREVQQATLRREVQQATLRREAQQATLRQEVGRG